MNTDPRRNLPPPPDPSRVARIVNARHFAGENLRRYRQPVDRVTALEMRCEALEAALYELTRRAA